VKAATRDLTAQSFTGPGQYQRGLTALIAANAIWLLLPIYWKNLAHIPPIEVLCHRSLWGFLLVILLLWGRGGLREVLDIVKIRRTFLFMIGCSMVHMFNWGFYIWAIGAGHILDTALGQYILPLLSVLCGTAIFREHPRPLQWLAIICAAIGVCGMILFYGSLPWIGLVSATTAVTFAVFRKKAPVNAMPALTLELLISAPILWSYFIYLTVSGKGTFGTLTFAQDLWLVGAGIVTILPQMGYAFALCRVPLTTISLMQYIPPTGSFLIGCFLFGEDFSSDKIFGFAFIWAGLLLFTLDGFLYYQGHRKRIAYGPLSEKEGS
jgi:chloramphenicol-sensitive protein RarD